jgi:hypothetical protein
MIPIWDRQRPKNQVDYRQFELTIVAISVFIAVTLTLEKRVARLRLGA